MIYSDEYINHFHFCVMSHTKKVKLSLKVTRVHRHLFIFFKRLIYLRERQHEQKGQRISNRLRTELSAEPDSGLDPRTLRP